MGMGLATLQGGQTLPVFGQRAGKKRPQTFQGLLLRSAMGLHGMYEPGSSMFFESLTTSRYTIIFS
jgi:hypothetical protein